MTTANDLPDVMHLHELKICNLGLIEAMTIDANGKHVSITGPNRVGKTTASEALWMLVKEWRSKDHPDPIRHGEKSAVITGDFGAMTITRTIKKNRTNLLVEADGEELSNPRQVLDALLDGGGAMNLGIFLSARPQDQIAEVLRAYDIEPPVDEVQALLGERIEAEPDESAAAYAERVHDEIYQRRLLQGRIVGDKDKAAREALEELTTLGGRPGPEEKAMEPGTVSKALAELYGQRDARGEQAEKVRKAKEQSEQTERNQRGIVEAIESDEREIANLKEMIWKKGEHLFSLKKNLDEGTETLTCNNALILRLTKQYDAMPDPAVEIGEKRLLLEKNEEHNEGLAKRGQAATFADRLLDEHEDAKAAHEFLELALKNVRELSKHLLDGVDMDAEIKLEIRDGKVYINDAPIVSAALSERITLACELAARRKPKIRMIRIDDAEHFDNNSKKVIYRICEKYNFRAFLVGVDADATEKKLSVEIVDVES